MNRHYIKILFVICTFTCFSSATMSYPDGAALTTLSLEKIMLDINDDTTSCSMTNVTYTSDINRNSIKGKTINDSSNLTVKPDHKYPNVFKITPLKIFGLINPSIELSYERRTGHRFSTQVMASYLLPFSFMDIGSEFKPDIKGFRVSLEEKFYFEKSAPIGSYLSFEFNYLNNQYKDIWNFGEEDIYADLPNNNNYSDTFGIKKQTYSFNLKLGYQIVVKRISFDFYAGLGLRYKDVNHFDRINPNDEMEMPRHPNVYYITNQEGKYWTVSIPLNVRIGWTF